MPLALAAANIFAQARAVWAVLGRDQRRSRERERERKRKSQGERQRERARRERERESESEREREKERKTVYHMTRTRDIIRQPGRSNEINSE